MSVAADNPLRQVAASLAAGKFVDGEQQLTKLLLDHLGRPEGPSLFRLLQFNTDDSLVERFDQFKDDIETIDDPLLNAAFATLVGAWSTDDLDNPEHQRLEHFYQSLVDGVERKTSRVSLFEQQSDKLLWVNLNVPIKTCNYRCSYCYLDHEVKPSLQNIARTEELIAQLGRIKRPIAVTFSTHGEILALPKAFPYFGLLAALPNLVFVETWTNLSRDLTGITKYCPVEKLAVVASYHPSEFRDFEDGHRKFVDRVAYLKEHAYDITVNFVAAAVEMPYFARIKRDLRKLDVHFTVNPLIGNRNGDGKNYPDAFSATEKRRIVKWYGNDIAAYFQMLNKASIRCSAGRDHIDVKPDGTLYRCEFFTMYPSEPSYGNLLDGTATIDLTNRYCSMGGCACKSTIGWAEPVVAEYKRVGTQHHYVRRKPGEIGQHSYDPVKPDQIVPTPQTVSLLDIDPAMDAASARAEAEDRVPIAVRR